MNEAFMDDTILEKIKMSDLMDKLKDEDRITPSVVSCVLADMLEEKVQDAVSTVKSNLDYIVGRSISSKKINQNTDGYKAENHEGTWYVIDSTYYEGEKFYLMESEQWGDEAPCIAVAENGDLVAEGLMNGFDDDFEDAAYKYINDNKFEWINVGKESEFYD